MTEKTIAIRNLRIDNAAPFVLLGGVNVLESRDFAMRVAEHYVEVCGRLNITYVFKASYDKANRSSLGGRRGPGLEEGLAILAEIRARLGVPVLTDVHSVEQCAVAANAVDVLQIPAFLCRQTDLLLAARETGRAINIKKGQFMDPINMGYAIKKVTEHNNKNIMITK